MINFWWPGFSYLFPLFLPFPPFSIFHFLTLFYSLLSYPFLLFAFPLTFSTLSTFFMHHFKKPKTTQSQKDTADDVLASLAPPSRSSRTTSSGGSSHSSTVDASHLLEVSFDNSFWLFNACSLFTPLLTIIGWRTRHVGKLSQNSKITW